MEFLLRMQVPDGQPFAGMAQHKVHDDNWTGFPTRPQV
jgi:endoglucanase